VVALPAAAIVFTQIRRDLRAIYVTTPSARHFTHNEEVQLCAFKIGRIPRRSG
jgi:hypothetical protein